MGLHQAFPEALITGVDIEFQPNYPFHFIQEDALDFPLDGYDFIWASPPCQRYSAMTLRWGQEHADSHPDLIAPVRSLLEKTGVPYCIENVMGAPLVNPVMLCGTMFNLTTKHGSQLRRHRIFETDFSLPSPPECNHRKGSVIGVYGGGQHPNRRIPATIVVYGNSGGVSNRDGLTFFTTQDRRDAMGIQWMVGKELSAAIPPAYSHWIGEALKLALGERVENISSEAA